MAHDCPDDDCGLLERKISELRQEIERLTESQTDKHQQNRKDIHDLRNKQQETIVRQAILEQQLKPILGNGKPGILDEFAEQLREFSAALQSIREERAADAGVKHFLYRALPIGVGMMALIVPVAVVLLQHLWK